MKKTRLNPVNRKRRQSEFARCYHSKERVAFVKSLGCCWCNSQFHIDNAHKETDGMGRKAGYATIVPLCRTCHSAYDEYRDPFDRIVPRALVEAYAVHTEKLWQSHIQRRSNDAA